MYFSSVIIEEKEPYTHTLTSCHQLFFDVFVTFSSKPRCLSAKLDTLTSKQIGVCSKIVVFLPVTKPFFCRFYCQKHIHSYTHFNSQIGFWIQISFELRIAVSSGSHFELLLGSRRPMALFRGFSGDFLHKVSVSKNCFIFPFWGV